ncbi:MAG: hypothetical protein ACHREM_33925, partial [Polyangiales bacterium]
MSARRAMSVGSCVAALVACSDGASSTGAPWSDASAIDATIDATIEVAPNDAVTSDAPTLDSEVSGDAALGLEGGTYFFELDAAPFPGTGHPDVAVHVPPGFRPDSNVGCIVYFHGFDNCVTNVVGNVDSPCPPDTTVRAATHLSDQLDAAKVNAFLVAVEIDYDQATGNPGALANKGQLAALMHELLTEHLAAIFGRTVDVAALSRVVIGSHSGGYEAAAMSISVGGLTSITEVDLYDSLYGYLTTYDDWVTTHLARFDATRADRLRFATEYTAGGGTAVNARAMAASAETWVGDAGLEASLLFDD